MSKESKIVLITGGSKGIGAQIAYDFAKEGKEVIITYNQSYERAKELKEKIYSEYNKKIKLIKCDISKENEIINMIQKIKEEYKKIDILVNNAGIAYDSEFDEKSANDFKKILNTNLIGTYLVSKHIGKIMLENKKGKIINIASDNGIDAYYPESCDYDASKAGVISLTHNMAKFYSPYINVNCICPGWIETDMNKDLSKEQKEKIKSKILIKRFGKPEDISNIVLFLSKEESEFINDAVIKVNGGISNE